MLATENVSVLVTENASLGGGAENISVYFRGPGFISTQCSEQLKLNVTVQDRYELCF